MANPLSTRIRLTRVVSKILYRFIFLCRNTGVFPLAAKIPALSGFVLLLADSLAFVPYLAADSLADAVALAGVVPLLASVAPFLPAVVSVFVPLLASVAPFLAAVALAVAVALARVCVVRNLAAVALARNLLTPRAKNKSPLTKSLLPLMEF